MSDSPQAQPNNDAQSDIERAIEHLREGKLPAPKTWDELTTGMAVWLSQHWSDESGDTRPCACCGSQDWEYGHVVGLSSDPRWPIGPQEHYGSFPHFQLSCKDCGNTVLINALSVFQPQRPWDK
jgi:hypothetical protein